MNFTFIKRAEIDRFNYRGERVEYVNWSHSGKYYDYVWRTYHRYNPNATELFLIDLIKEIDARDEATQQAMQYVEDWLDMFVKALPHCKDAEYYKQFREDYPEICEIISLYVEWKDYDVLPVDWLENFI